ncbi:ankyrin repeat domain-containing protein [Pantoea agglomerans]|uniref:ankyrin repeat domain-containing protein n=1 Tax=Enterobacter agglomerans TaxID=549 RepID=UPI0028C4514A|nr:ankyrin repeat domain-containing protein [Pantoea agglomerans]WNN33204.1 ankyrin repeat domain-containing protein [Pantoea agglomerans]
MIRKVILLPLMFSLLTLQACDDMKKIHPEDYFSGSQLQLAQAIEDGNVDEVEKLSTRTDLNKPGEKDLTLLYYALSEASKKDVNRLNIMSVLVKHGANPLQYVVDMGTVATNTAGYADPVFFKALIKGGMDKNARFESTPIIFYATNEKAFPTLKYLVEIGTDVNAKDSLGQTAIFEGMYGRQYDQVEYLLHHGAHANVTDVNNVTFNQLLDKIISNTNKDNTKALNKLEDIKNLAQKN